MRDAAGMAPVESVNYMQWAVREWGWRWNPPAIRRVARAMHGRVARLWHQGVYARLRGPSGRLRPVFAGYAGTPTGRGDKRHRRR